VLIAEQEANHDPNTLEICRDVRAEIQRSLDAGEAEEGTPIYGTMQRLITMLNPALTFRRLRRGRRFARRE
ncbi:hypothetical protein A2U01_0102224, partial [Trifolium medium]|nr:hypothetical protein [Trifolium medium]